MQFAFGHLLTKELKDVFVLIELVRAYIYHKMERVGNDVVLGATFYNGY